MLAAAPPCVCCSGLRARRLAARRRSRLLLGLPRRPLFPHSRASAAPPLVPAASTLAAASVLAARMVHAWLEVEAHQLHPAAAAVVMGSRAGAGI